LRAAAPSGAKAAPASSFSLGKLLAVALVGGLGGYALYTRKKRKGIAALQPASGLRVLESTRLGPKASLVTAQVGRRVILLGVTDGNISKLGWLPNEAAEAEAEASIDAVMPASRVAATPSPARLMGAEEPKPKRPRPSDGTFAARLRGALGGKAVSPASDDALAVSSQLTRDVVDLRGSRKRARAAVSSADDAMIDVEAQAAGLIKRLKGKQQ
jgi:flagellar biogenesis protein FliO